MNKQQKNDVVVKISQHIPSYVNKAGNTILPFDNEVEFRSASVQETTAENVAIFAMCSLKKYLTIKRLQGKIGFKMSKDVKIEIAVNNKVGETEMKFSLNLDRMQRAFEKSPTLVAAVFTSVPNHGGLTVAKGLKWAGMEGKLVLAAARKEDVAGLLQEANDESIHTVQQEETTVQEPVSLESL